MLCNANSRNHLFHILVHSCDCTHGFDPDGVVRVGSTAVGVQLPLMLSSHPELLLCAEHHLSAMEPLAIARLRQLAF